MKYLGVFGVLLLLCLLPLMQGVSFNTVVFSIVSGGVFFVAVKTADEKNLLEKIHPVNFPKILVNDLYKKLNHGTDKTE